MFSHVFHILEYEGRNTLDRYPDRSQIIWIKETKKMHLLSLSNFTKFILFAICIAQLSANRPPQDKGEKSIVYAFDLTLLYRECVTKHSRCWGPAPYDVKTGTNNNSIQPRDRQLAAASFLFPVQTWGRITQQNNRFFERELRGCFGDKAANRGLITGLWTSIDALG